MTIIAMALRGRHTEDKSSVTRRHSFIHSLDKPARARGSVIIASSSIHPPRRATRPIRVATSTTRPRLYIFYIASHRSIGPSDRSDAVARVTHHSSILFIHRGRGVRHPRSIVRALDDVRVAEIARAFLAALGVTANDGDTALGGGVDGDDRGRLRGDGHLLGEHGDYDDVRESAAADGRREGGVRPSVCVCAWTLWGLTSSKRWREDHQDHPSIHL